MAPPMQKASDNIWDQVLSLLFEQSPLKNNEENLKRNTVIYRRSKRLRNGDAIIPRGRLSDVSSETWQHIYSEIETRSKTWSTPVTCGQPTKEAVAVFHLQRPHAFQHVLKLVQTQGNQYGLISDRQGDNIFLNCSHINTQQNKSLDHLEHVREIILLDHIMKLLTATGYSVAGIISDSNQWDAELLQMLNATHISEKIVDASLPCGSSVVQSTLCQAAKKSNFRHHFPTDSAVTPNKDDSVQNHIVLDLKNYLDSEEGKCERIKGFDKNLHLVKVTEGDDPTLLMLRVSQLDSCSKVLQQKEDQPVRCCLHLVPSSAIYVQQQIHLVWKILSENCKQLQQAQVVFGGTTKRKSPKEPIDCVTAEEYVRLRKLQMENAAALKYGDDVSKGIEWDHMIKNLTEACMKFEILSTNCRNPLKLDLSDTSKNMEDHVDNCGGPFVMYNCARLAMLFRKFDEDVKNGIYPSLPNLSQCDMSLLKLEEEWTLLYNFVEPYPSLVQSTVPTIGDCLYLNIQTHKVTGFLVSLSHCLSSYYSRVHVLGEPRRHLLPLMYARLHLLTAVHQVMLNGLQLLNIEPASQL
ncbi:DALR anticodon-binding domain-containing protein 3 [Octopus sinensis]|uniref:DALR anticodon-binding domain-containing protein 3 n=1 Tax=Octopus sinensis TaxID=2607531 RepID=A0A6P7S9Q2_9MOLL|nr:DALR anticodon-binding domain-containing protein 3 [Octopus sinensis]XP_036358475.1 DALR anticodon-binding domain-containing protein 3 [Octopus sinensis]XP_036358476.1 DALR anticodon-binding domain-containing protein 3 [Octopus sinensis]XP_036358477.1 DALR anticodon-binding domain-containing protein 3 [Octopus sinensis]